MEDKYLYIYNQNKDYHNHNNILVKYNMVYCNNHTKNYLYNHYNYLYNHYDNNDDV